MAHETQQQAQGAAVAGTPPAASPSSRTRKRREQRRRYRLRRLACFLSVLQKATGMPLAHLERLIVRLPCAAGPEIAAIGDRLGLTERRMRELFRAAKLQFESNAEKVTKPFTAGDAGRR